MAAFLAATKTLGTQLVRREDQGKTQFAPAVAVAVIFGLLSGIHIFEAIVFRKRYAWVLIMGAAWETAAFVLHSLGARDQQQIGYATSWQILFLLAPLWVNAFVYMSFGRMAWFFLPGQKIAGIKRASIAKYFVWADVITFTVQGVGGIMASPGAGTTVIRIGLDIYLAGMGIQQFFILLFLVLMITFHRRAVAMSSADIPESGRPRRSRKPLRIALYGVLTCITVRIIYRIAEFAGGITPSNPVPFHEEYSYALDCFPMMIALLVLAIWHPGRTLVGPGSEFPTRSRAEKKAEKEERKAAKVEAKREKKATKQSIAPESLNDDEDTSQLEVERGGSTGAHYV